MEVSDGVADNTEYEVQLGDTFRSNSNNAFYSLQYMLSSVRGHGFRPRKASETRGQVAKPVSAGTLELEFVQQNENGETQTHYFRGSSEQAKSVDCVLIFEKGKGFTLERLQGTVKNLQPTPKPEDSALNGPIPSLPPAIAMKRPRSLNNFQPHVTKKEKREEPTPQLFNVQQTTQRNVIDQSRGAEGHLPLPNDSSDGESSSSGDDLVNEIEGNTENNGTYNDNATLQPQQNGYITTPPSTVVTPTTGTTVTTPTGTSLTPTTGNDDEDLFGSGSSSSSSDSSSSGSSSSSESDSSDSEIQQSLS